MDANTVNIRTISVWWGIYVLCNTWARLGAEFMRKLSNTEAELKKSVAYKKKRVVGLFLPDDKETNTLD